MSRAVAPPPMPVAWRSGSDEEGWAYYRASEDYIPQDAQPLFASQIAHPEEEPHEPFLRVWKPKNGSTWFILEAGGWTPPDDGSADTLTLYRRPEYRARWCALSHCSPEKGCDTTRAALAAEAVALRADVERKNALGRTAMEALESVANERDALRTQLEVVASDTTNADLRQEIEFLKAEHAAQVAELAGVVRNLQIMADVEATALRMDNKRNLAAHWEKASDMARAALAKVAP